jgi:hypothetical protein
VSLQSGKWCRQAAAPKEGRFPIRPFGRRTRDRRSLRRRFAPHSCLAAHRLPTAAAGESDDPLELA